MSPKLIRGIVAFLVLAGPVHGVPPAAGEPVLWFDRLIGVEALPEAAELELARYITRAFLDPVAPRPELPATLASDRAPRMIFASLSDGRSPARVHRGAGLGAPQALRALLDRSGEAVPATRWAKIDVVREVVRETGIDPRRRLRLPRSLNGLAFEPAVGAAFLPEELVAQTLVDSDQELRLRKIDARLTTPGQVEALERAVVSDRLTLYRFSTSAYFSDGGEPLPLYRGHRRFAETSPELLLDAARAGGEYLERAVRPGGRFAYAYLPKTDSEKSRYNILRHAGTVYSMLELYEVSGDEGLRAAAERAIGYLERAVKPCPTGETFGDPEARCVVEKDFVKLGGNALAIVALAKHAEVTGARTHLELIDRLGRWILATQSDAGEFTVHKIHQPTGVLDDHVSQYYPGEALLALLRGSRLKDARSGDTPVADPWLDAAARGARWLIEVRDRGLPGRRLNHDHWLLYALNELYRRRPDPLYLEHAGRITDAILGRQNRRPVFPDWHGSYYRPPRSTPTATRSEGLAAAYFLERDFGDGQRAGRLLEGLELGVRFQLQTQLRPESSLYLPNPRRGLGGFRRSLTNYEVRIDYVQHNISALLMLRRILLERSAAAQ